MKAWSSLARRLAATAAVWRCASRANSGERTSGTQIWTGRRPRARSRRRCSRTRLLLLGTRSLDDTAWLLADEQREVDLAEKRRLLDTTHDVVSASRPGAVTDAAACEAAALVAASSGHVLDPDRPPLEAVLPVDVAPPRQDRPVDGGGS